eukprot:CAMPEP_0171141682 /NCGR_PEP_ID=MMETSP0766_2-20121228/141040_2 /TAXON_ID=439317 /ORGANISM="Gambierdiscus australes, Strain CAWD 149" /LENGTH=112 /DNA_ID=CAMNT_0011605415 /DNA_START=55 /DNA_END=391 /DNA_ORIENTATION=-
MRVGVAGLEPGIGQHDHPQPFAFKFWEADVREATGTCVLQLLHAHEGLLRKILPPLQGTPRFRKLDQPVCPDEGDPPFLEASSSTSPPSRVQAASTGFACASPSMTISVTPE